MTIDRRSFLTAALAGSAGFARVAAQAPTQPPSSAPTPRDWSKQEPLQYPDPDIVALDDASAATSSATRRSSGSTSGTLWAEGPAWNGVGRYLVWSDIPNNVQLRWIEEDGRVTVFRNPSGQQQRQHVRFRGAAAFVRARRTPRRSLRAERRGHRDRR